MDGIASVNGAHKPPFYWLRHGDGVAVVYQRGGIAKRRFAGPGADVKAANRCDELLEAYFLGQKELVQ